MGTERSRQSKFESANFLVGNFVVIALAPRVGCRGGEAAFNQTPWNPVKTPLKKPVTIQSKSLGIMRFPVLERFGQDNLVQSLDCCVLEGAGRTLTGACMENKSGQYPAKTFQPHLARTEVCKTS